MRSIIFIFASVSILVGAAWAGKISDSRMRFSVLFPDSDGWSAVERSAPTDGVTRWSSMNEAIDLSISMTMIDAPMPGPSPAFREDAAAWERGLMKQFSKKLSGRFTSLSGVDACEVITTYETKGAIFYFANWYVQVDNISYCMTITSSERARVSGDEAAAFVQSFRLNEKKKGGEPGATDNPGDAQ